MLQGYTMCHTILVNHLHPGHNVKQQLSIKVFRTMCHRHEEK